MNKYRLKYDLLAVAISIGIGIWQGWALAVAWIAFWVLSEAFEHFATRPGSK